MKSILKITLGVFLGGVLLCVCAVIAYNYIISLPRANSTRINPNVQSATEKLKIEQDWKCGHSSTGNMRIEGRINNEGDVAVRFVKLRASILDNSDRVLNSQFFYSDSDMIPAGGSSTFSTILPDPDGIGTKCRIGLESADYR